MGLPRTFTLLAVVNAVMLYVTTGLAFHFARQRRITLHRQWMTRSYAVALAFFANRFVLGVTGLENCRRRDGAGGHLGLPRNVGRSRRCRQRLERAPARRAVARERDDGERQAAASRRAAASQRAVSVTAGGYGRLMASAKLPSSSFVVKLQCP